MQYEISLATDEYYILQGLDITLGYKAFRLKDRDEFIKAINSYNAAMSIFKGGHRAIRNIKKIFNWFRIDVDGGKEEYDRVIEILNEHNLYYIDKPGYNFGNPDKPEKAHSRHIYIPTEGVSQKIDGYKDQAAEVIERLGLDFIQDKGSMLEPDRFLRHRWNGDVAEGIKLTNVHQGEPLKLIEVDDDSYPSNEDYSAKKGHIQGVNVLEDHTKLVVDESKFIDGSSTVMTDEGIVSLKEIASQLQPGERISIGCIWHNEEHTQGFDHVGYGYAMKHEDGNTNFECKGAHGCSDKGSVILIGSRLAGEDVDVERIELSDKEVLIIDEYKKKLKKVKKHLKSITPKKITKPFKIPSKVDKHKKYVKKIARVPDEIERDRYITKLSKATGATKTSIKKEVKKAMAPSPEYLKVSSIHYKLSKLVNEMRTQPPLDAVIAYEMSNVNGEAAINAKKKELAEKFKVDKSTIAKIHASASIDWNAIDKALGGKVYWELKQGRFFVHNNNSGIEYLGKTEQFKQTLRSKTGTSDKNALDFILAKIPAANIVYDPTHTIDEQAGYVNAHVRIDLGDGDASMPPIVKAALDNVFKYQMEDREHFINWMAYIMQTGKRTGVAWAFYGEQGAGKGLLIDAFSYALGVKNCALNVGNDSVEADFTDYAMHKSLLQLNEVALGKGQRRAISGKIKAFITDPTLNIRLKGLSDVQVVNHLNLILNSNNNAPIEIETTDRRWNVVKTGEPKRFEDDFGRQPISEIGKQLGRYLMQYEIDEVAATRILPKNEAKRAIERRTNPRLHLMLTTIAEWDLDEFLKLSHYEDIDESNIGIPSKKQLKKAFMQHKFKVKWLHDIGLAIGVFEKHETQTHIGIRINDALPDSLVKVKTNGVMYLRESR